MKVLWLSHFIPVPPHGGSPQRSYNLIRELAKEFEVYFVGLDPRRTPPPGPQLEKDLDLLRAVCAGVERIPHTKSFAFKHKFLLFLLGLVNRTPVTTLRLDSPPFRERLRAIHKKISFDLVHLDTIDLVGYLSDCPRCPVVLNHHNVESDLLRQKASTLSSPILRTYLRLQARRALEFEREYCGRVDCNFAVSEIDKARFGAIAPGARFEVIPNGVDTDYFRSPPESVSESGDTVLWVGGMTWFPNREAVLFFLREVWPLIVRENESTRLVIVGREPPEEWRKAARSDQIECPGFVDDVRPYFDRAAVFVVPIRYGGGTRLKVLDAMASGKAIVSTSVGCEGIAVQDGRDLLTADSAEEFAGAVTRLLRDPEERKRLGNAGRRMAEMVYSWRVIGEKLRSTARALAGGGKERDE